MRKLLVAAIVAAGIFTVACGGLFDESSCPSDYPVDCNDGTCCPSGYVCNGDKCSSSGGGGGGATDLWVSANGCRSGNIYSYRGTNSSVCYSYYNAARADSCTKILWKC